MVHEGLARFFNRETFSDLTVVDPDGNRIRCHQLVLSSCSRKFADMLEQGALSNPKQAGLRTQSHTVTQGWGLRRHGQQTSYHSSVPVDCMQLALLGNALRVIFCKRPKHSFPFVSAGKVEELPVRGVDAQGLYLVLRFFYTGECHVDHTSVIAVYDAANRLDVDGLATACDVYSKQLLGPGTACTLFQQAQRFALQEFAESCSRIIRVRFDEVVHSEDFLTVDRPTLMKILEDNIPHHNEGSIFRAAWRWGMSSLARMQEMPKVFKMVKVRLQQLPASGFQLYLLLRATDFSACLDCHYICSRRCRT